MLLTKSTFTCISFQPVVVIALVQAAYNVRIQQDNVLAMLDTKAPNVMLLVVVIILVQVAQLVMLLRVNVLAKVGIQVPLVTLSPVLPTSSKKAMEQHVQVSQITQHKLKRYANKKEYFIFSACNCDATGSSSLQCADSTGQCTCNAGYKGTKCDAACGCDTTGSSGTACDASSGQCTCKTGYTGTTCNSCSTNYYKASDGVTCTGECVITHLCKKLFLLTFYPF